METEFDKEYFLCQCESLDHLLIFTYWKDPEPKWDEVYVNYRLNHYLPWYKRIWYAVRYIFKWEINRNHWSEIALTPKDLDKLIASLVNYKEKINGGW